MLVPMHTKQKPLRQWGKRDSCKREIGVICRQVDWHGLHTLTDAATEGCTVNTSRTGTARMVALPPLACAWRRSPLGSLIASSGKIRESVGIDSQKYPSVLGSKLGRTGTLTKVELSKEINLTKPDRTGLIK